MKETDLRIGNYVNYLGEVQEVTGIDSEYVYLDTITFYYVEHDEIEPIPITEEWLLKLGFLLSSTDESVKEYCLTFGAFRFYSDCSNNFETITIRLNKTTLELRYIHELQNLYHAITGKELKIK